MNNKKIILIILSVLVFAFASCKSNENPEVGGSAPSPFKVSSIIGTWTSAANNKNTFTVKDNGKIEISVGSKTATLTIENWNKYKEVSQYKLTLSSNIEQQDVNFIFTFKSANSCDLTMTGAT